MPYTEEDLDRLNIWFDVLGHATVFVGPCSSTSWRGAKIPLDGRRYRCAGKIYLKTGQVLFANLPIVTNDFDFLDRDQVYCQLNELWYGMDEARLYQSLGVTMEQALPYTWLPDIPLDYHETGHYPMHPYRESPEAKLSRICHECGRPTASPINAPTEHKVVLSSQDECGHQDASRFRDRPWWKFWT